MNRRLDPTQLTSFLMALVWTLPRILGLLAAIPAFPASVLPGMLRTGVAASLGMIVAPALVAPFAATEMTMGVIAAVLLKEIFIGFVMGCLIAVPFWAFEAVGFLVDNQRGASISSTLNPLTGHNDPLSGV